MECTITRQQALDLLQKYKHDGKHDSVVMRCSYAVLLAEMGESEESYKELQKLLEEKVVGQEKAVSAVAQTLQRGLSGIRDERKPIASMLFTGPTGVGKTELCRALAEELYGSPKALIRLDMTEYIEVMTEKIGIHMTKTVRYLRWMEILR